MNTAAPLLAATKELQHSFVQQLILAVALSSIAHC